MGSAPSPPPAPDPNAVASAQTGENVDTALANASLSHVNQVDQYGDSSTYSTNGNTSFTDPTSGDVYQIPNYTQTTQLSPQNQQIYNSTENAEQNLANSAVTASASAQQALDTPVNLQGVNLQQLGSAGQYNSSTGQTTGAGANSLANADLSAGSINNFINTNWEQPLAYSQGNQQEQLNQNLADQGINLNDPAYNQAQINEGQNFQQQQDTYANAMYGTAASDMLQGASLADQNTLNTQQSNNNATLAQQGFNNQVQVTNQQQPINEIDALLSGSQVSPATFASTPQTTIPTTDYAQISQNSYQDQLASYNAQVQAQSASNAGLFGIGGAVLGGLTHFLPSDRRLKTDVQRVGSTKTGIPVYKYRYLACPSYGWVVGVMSDEVRKVLPAAVEIGIGGMDRVNYAMVR